MTNTPEQTLSDLLALGEKATKGEWKTHLCDETMVCSADRDVAEVLGDYDTDECEQMAADAAFIAASKNALPALREYMEEVKWLRGHVEALIENDPDDIIADGGHTVLDLWRHEAKRRLSRLGGK